MSKEITRVVPCDGSWSVGTPMVDDDGMPDSVCYTPVVAWVVFYDQETESTWATPVTPELLRVSDDQWILKSPGGELIEPEIAHYMDEPELIHNWRVYAQAVKDREAAKKAASK